MEILKLENICKTFGKGDSCVQALKGVNLTINKGEMIAIIGTSGSGKSTLLNILGTLERPSSGKYFINGRDVSEFKEKELASIRNKTFGFVVQNFALIKGFTVYENVEIPLEYNKKSNKKESDVKIKEKLTKLKIRDKIYNKPGELSGGQCQRVAIARALVNDCEIILVDEPTGSLDKKTGKEVVDIFKDLNKEGKTVIIVTHDISIANQCERIIRIEDGNISIDI